MNPPHRTLPARARARDARARPVPERAVKWMPPTRHMTGDFPPRPAGRVLQPGRCVDRSGHPACRHDDRGSRYAAAVDRDLALQNVRYVMNAAGNLHEDFVCRRRRLPSEQRACAVLDATVVPLGDVVRHDDGRPAFDQPTGAFGPDEAAADAGRRAGGRGRATVQRLLQPGDPRSPGGSSEQAGRATGTIIRPQRRDHRRADGRRSASTPPIGRAGPHLQGLREGAAAAAARTIGIRPARSAVHADADGAGLHVLRGLRRIEFNDLVDTSWSRMVERDDPPLTKGGERRDQAGAAPPASPSLSAVHRHRHAHRRHRRDPQHRGLRRREGASRPTASFEVADLGARCRVPQLVERARAEKARRGAGLAVVARARRRSPTPATSAAFRRVVPRRTGARF